MKLFVAIIALALACTSHALNPQDEAIISTLRDHPELVEQLAGTNMMEGLKRHQSKPNSFSSEMNAFFAHASELNHNLRRLMDESNHAPILDEAWDEIDGPYPASNTLLFNNDAGGDDKVKIYAKGDTCWLVARETDQLGDMWNNLDLGKEVISSSVTSGRYNYCRCAKSNRRGSCKTRSVCSKSLGEGFDGFVKPYNALRFQIKSYMGTYCGGLTKFVYAGYSRGGGIAMAMAFAHMKDGLAKSSDHVQLVTFGSPRVLEKKDAYDLANFVDVSFRAVKSGVDLVPSVPPSWFGHLYDESKMFWHVPSVTIPSSVGENDPPALTTLNVLVHLQYGNVYGSN